MMLERDTHRIHPAWPGLVVHDKAGARAQSKPYYRGFGA